MNFFHFKRRVTGNTSYPVRPEPGVSVHPRVGGEHGIVGQSRSRCRGSSPRGRGTRWSRARDSPACRFIPAWAGNTRSRSRTTGASSVHPRVGGEHTTTENLNGRPDGSSPRGRGTLLFGLGAFVLGRFIPAWAGNTWSGGGSLPAPTVHPRVGGEHSRIGKDFRSVAGSSPRGRGTRHDSTGHRVLPRFIPAWAGNTGSGCVQSGQAPVHPRVGGEHRSSAGEQNARDGSSPRGRGTPAQAVGHGIPDRFIPAWAGNTISACAIRRTTPVHPRVGGEHSSPLEITDDVLGSSPRGRGTHPNDPVPTRRRRFIPAWAGNTIAPKGYRRRNPVHPRVGGEHGLLAEPWVSDAPTPPGFQLEIGVKAQGSS